MKKLAFLFGFLFIGTAVADDVINVDTATYRNVQGIIDCIDCVGEDGRCVKDRKSGDLTGKWQKGNVKFRSNSSYNRSATRAACVAMPPDSSYVRIAGKKIKTEWFGDDPITVPELENGKIYRYVATQCEKGYEISKDRRGKSLGWCRKKNARKSRRSAR